MKEKCVHQKFQHHQGHNQHHDQIKAIDASQFQENHGGKRDGDEVAEVSNPPHHLGGQARHDSRSTHWITSPALGRGFSLARWIFRVEIGTDLHDEIAYSILALAQLTLAGGAGSYRRRARFADPALTRLSRESLSEQEMNNGIRP